MDQAMELNEKISQAVWIAKKLFDRNKTSGSSANLSFLHGDRMYITAGGSCFGCLRETDFAAMEGERTVGNRRPSKEWPAHQALYRGNSTVRAVIHTHSRYSVLWSFMEGLREDDCVPGYTPYLDMKVGKIGLIPYYAPGSEELFAALTERAGSSGGRGYLLKRHGPIVGAESLMEAFAGIEELEESCAVAWNINLKGLGRV